MPKGLVTKSYLEDIADAIRDRSGSSEEMTVSEMAMNIENIPSSGTYVEANVEMTGSEDTLESIQIGEEVYAIKTYQKFPSTWVTDGTVKQFLDSVDNDSVAVEGMAFLGELACTNLPEDMVNAEAVVEITKSAVGGSKVIHITITSGNKAPYRWEKTYWNHGHAMSDWISFLNTDDVQANPVLQGGEADLTSIKIKGTNYSIPSGGSNTPDFGKKILSEDTLVFENDEAPAPNFKNFIEETFQNDYMNVEWWENWVGDSQEYGTEFHLPQDYRFTVVYKDGHSETVSFARNNDIDNPAATPWETGLPAYKNNESNIWNYGYGTIWLEGTSENSCSMHFEFPSGLDIYSTVSIETETEDPWIYFSDDLYSESSEDLDLIDKFIVWTPSCNEHWENPVLEDTYLVTDTSELSLQHLKASIEKMIEEVGEEGNYGGPVNSEFKIKGVSVVILSQLFESFDPEAINILLAYMYENHMTIVADLNYTDCTDGASRMITPCKAKLELAVETDIEDPQLVVVIKDADTDEPLASNIPLFGSVYLWYDGFRG